MEGVALPAGPNHLPLRGVSIARWRQECEARSLSTAEDQKDRARVFRKASADLRTGGRIAMRDTWVWTTREGQPDA
jgi:ketosteroid isomerase-like protein